jgi:hypothetical protein
MKKILLLIIIFTAHLAKAQEEVLDVCIQNIEIAQQRYDEGRIQDIQPLLNDCLKGGTYTKAEKSQVLRLLTLSYIFLENEEKAEATMLQLIESNHEFLVNPAIDPTEFINLHEQFRYKPVFNVGVRYIANFAQPIVSDLNSSFSLTDTRPEYSIIFGFIGFGLNFEWEFLDNLILYPEIHYKNMSVSRIEYQPGIISGAEYITQTNYEDQVWLSLPVSVKYVFDFQTIPTVKAYANLGASLDYLLSAKRPSDGTILETPNDPVVGFNSTTTEDKNRLNYGIFAGGGVTYKAGEGFVSLEVRYLYSLSKVTTAENILNPTDPTQFNSGVQDDVYRMNHIAISLGYTLNIYMPKQLR